MALQLSEEVESTIRARASAAGFRTPEEYILDLLESDGPLENGEATAESRKDWRARFDAFVARQRSTNPHFDDSRESIYPDR